MVMRTLEFRDDGTAVLALGLAELQAIRGCLIEASEAITDEVAFSARVGASREEVALLRKQIRQLQVELKDRGAKY